MAQKMVRPIHILYQKSMTFGSVRGGPQERPEDDPKPEGPQTRDPNPKPGTQISPNERGSKKGLPDKVRCSGVLTFYKLGLAFIFFK